VVTVVFQLFLVPLLPGFPDMARQAGAVVLVTALVVFTAVSGTLDAGLVAMRATGPLLLKNLAGSVVKVVALLLLTRFGVTGLVLAYGSGTVLACILGGAVLWPRVAREGSQEGPAGLLRRYVSFSALSHLGTVLGILPSTVVPLEVLSMRGAHETAWFAVAFQVAAFLHFIPSTTAQVLFAEAQRVSLRRYLRKTLAGVYGLLIPAVAVTVLAAPYVLRIFGEGYSAGGTGCLRVLALGSLLTSGNYLVDSILISRDRTGSYIFMNGANAALVLSLVALLLPHGLTGAATGWALAQGLSLMLGAGVLVVNFATDADRLRFGLRT
jgi:O-antigen/teichoic acid export membrane protein